jgi:hypothetical protein
MRRYEEHLRAKQTQIEKKERKLEEQERDFTTKLAQVAASAPAGQRSLWNQRGR